MSHAPVSLIKNRLRTATHSATFRVIGGQNAFEDAVELAQSDLVQPNGGRLDWWMPAQDQKKAGRPWYRRDESHA